MQFMIIQKNDPQTEAGEMPSQELLHKVQAFIGDEAKAGRFVDGEGLLGSTTRTRVTFKSGKAVVKHGPYAGEHETPAAAWIVKTKDRDEAVRWAERYGKILGDGEIEIGKLIDPWEMGMGEKPADARYRFLLIDKADAASEGEGRSAKQKSDITRLKTEMTKAGVLEKAFTLAPTRDAKRLVAEKSNVRVFDGPFAESKELLGGFLLMELADANEAVAFCKRYMALHEGLREVDAYTVDTTPDAE
ncbi:MAG TPA: YciI family protein [Polyangiaceae bacterium]